MFTNFFVTNRVNYLLGMSLREITVRLLSEVVKGGQSLLNHLYSLEVIREADISLVCFSVLGSGFIPLEDQVLFRCTSVERLRAVGNYIVIAGHLANTIIGLGGSLIFDTTIRTLRGVAGSQHGLAPGYDTSIIRTLMRSVRRRFLAGTTCIFELEFSRLLSLIDRFFFPFEVKLSDQGVCDWWESGVRGVTSLGGAVNGYGLRLPVIVVVCAQV